MLYTHTTHRLFPLKTSSQTGAELTEISSMVSGEDREKTSPLSTPVDSQSSSTCNSPHTAKDKGRGRHGTPASLRNGLTESLLPPSLPSPSPTPSSPSTFSLPSQDKASLSPMRLSTLKRHTGIMSSYDHVNNIDSNCNGEVSNDPCNHASNEYQEVKVKEQSTSSSDEGRDLLCMPTYMPRFLLAYTPSVSLYLHILGGVPHTCIHWVVYHTRAYTGWWYHTRAYTGWCTTHVHTLGGVPHTCIRWVVYHTRAYAGWCTTHVHTLGGVPHTCIRWVVYHTRAYAGWCTTHVHTLGGVPHTCIHWVVYHTRAYTGWCTTHVHTLGGVPHTCTHWVVYHTRAHTGWCTTHVHILGGVPHMLHVHVHIVYVFPANKS